MGLETEVDAEPDAVHRITAVARLSSLPAFADLLWPPCPHPLELMRDPGVMFESPRRVVVFQRVGGELRYYTAGWCPDQARLHLEQDRVWAEGCELGVFGSVTDALTFAELYLARECAFRDIPVPRRVCWSRQPGAGEGMGCGRGGT